MSRRRQHPRNLAVVRAGPGSLHPQWIADPSRDFDIFVSEYGAPPGRWRGDADFHEHRAGGKWPCLHALLQTHGWLLAEYDAFWFPDDDLAADTAVVDRMFAFFHAHALDLAQPALTRNSFHTWATLLQDRKALLRYTGFVEVMAPLFSRRALAACVDSFAESESGWGLDWVWPTLCRRAGCDGIAVIDATPVRHTRPVGGGELYRQHPEMNPREDARRVLQRYGLQEVRAVAKYAIDSRVERVPLPLPTRLAYWLKRLNGRRKHLRAR